jgi:hypothetical protein
VSTGARAAVPGYEPTPGGAALSHRRSFGSSGASAYPPSQAQVQVSQQAPQPMRLQDKPSSGFVVASRYRSGSGSSGGAYGGIAGIPVPPMPPMPPVPALPAGVVPASLTRRPSGRDFRATVPTEETLLETESWDEHASAATERGTWGKGLGRQSSLPSRRREFAVWDCLCVCVY